MVGCLPRLFASWCNGINIKNKVRVELYWGKSKKRFHLEIKLQPIGVTSLSLINCSNFNTQLGNLCTLSKRRHFRFRSNINAALCDRQVTKGEKLDELEKISQLKN